jgi:hypothetical protein
MTDEPPTDATNHAHDPENGAPVDPLDEQLSAELDGGDAPAPDTAPSDPDDARVEGRRRALESARDLLSVPPPPLDDVTRKRLLRAAAAEWPRAKRRDPRWLNRAAAAALIVIVALTGLMVKALDNGSDGKASKSRAGAGASGTTALSGTAPHNLHEVSDPAVLRRRVEEVLHAGNSSADALRKPQLQQQSTTTAATERGGAPQAGSAARCLSAVRVPAGATPRILADATFDGAPAVVVVAHNGSQTLIFVLATADCRLLSSQFLRQ